MRVSFQRAEIALVEEGSAISTFEKLTSAYQRFTQSHLEGNQTTEVKT